MIHCAGWCIARGLKGSGLQFAVSQRSSNLQRRREALHGAASILCANHSLIDDIRGPETCLAQYRSNDLWRVWWKVLDETDEIRNALVSFDQWVLRLSNISMSSFLYLINILFSWPTSESQMTAITFMHLGFVKLWAPHRECSSWVLLQSINQWQTASMKLSCDRTWGT